jgi:hypothetical protein
MARPRKGTESRHGKRAANKTQTTLSLRKDVLAWAREQAAADGRSLSNWLERLLASQSAAEAAKTARARKKS